MAESNIGSLNAASVGAARVGQQDLSERSVVPGRQALENRAAAAAERQQASGPRAATEAIQRGAEASSVTISREAIDQLAAERASPAQAATDVSPTRANNPLQQQISDLLGETGATGGVSGGLSAVVSGGQQGESQRSASAVVASSPAEADEASIPGRGAQAGEQVVAQARTTPDAQPSASQRVAQLTGNAATQE